METVMINVKEALTKVLPKELKKDLQINERICPTCSGLGMVSRHNVYGIKGDKSPEAKNNLFPYDREALGFCSDCYNGVQRLCNHCGKPISKNHISKCDCAGYKAEEQQKKTAEWNKILENAEQVNEQDVSTYLYCEENGNFYETVGEFLEDWVPEDNDTESMPARLWVTEKRNLTFDASNVLENATQDLHEDAFECCDIDTLQKLLNDYAEEQRRTETYYPEYKQYVLTSFKEEGRREQAS